MEQGIKEDSHGKTAAWQLAHWTMEGVMAGAYRGGFYSLGAGRVSLGTDQVAHVHLLLWALVCHRARLRMNERDIARTMRTVTGWWWRAIVLDALGGHQRGLQAETTHSALICIWRFQSCYWILIGPLFFHAILFYIIMFVMFVMKTCYVCYYERNLKIITGPVFLSTTIVFYFNMMYCHLHVHRSEDVH